MNTTQRRAFARRAAALLALVCTAWTGAALAQATASARVPKPVIEKARGTNEGSRGSNWRSIQ